MEHPARHVEIQTTSQQSTLLNILTLTVFEQYIYMCQQDTFDKFEQRRIFWENKKKTEYVLPQRNSRHNNKLE